MGKLKWSEFISLLAEESLSKSQEKYIILYRMIEFYAEQKQS